jgi:hypothetical protein
MMLLWVTVGYSSVITLSGVLNSANENNPADTSPGTGTATVTLDTATHLMTIDVVFSGLLPFIPTTSTPSGTTASHIHCCIPPGGNAIVATTVPSFAGFPMGVDSGTFHTVLDLTLSASFNPAFVTANGGTVASADAALEAGFVADQSYLNIHTNAFPSGEIRALLTPEPGTAGLVLGGLIAALWADRRRGRI